MESGVLPPGLHVFFWNDYEFFEGGGSGQSDRSPLKREGVMN